MGRVLLNGPPDPAGRRWCPFCLMRAKQQQWTQYQDEIQAGYAAPGDKLTVIPWPAGLTAELSEGPYCAVPGDFPAMGMVDGLCWNDVAGLGAPAGPGGELDTSGLMPPGLAPRRRKGLADGSIS